MTISRADSLVRPAATALVVLAAGLSTRYGRLKQLDPVGPDGELLMDYTIADAVDAGVDRVVIVVREEIEARLAHHVVGALDRRGPESRAEVLTAVQRLDDLPGGRAVPRGRTRPWGTAHAIHAAREALGGVSAFVVANADDGYGSDAVRRIVRWAKAAPADEFALVPYRLGATLSKHGGVSRGVLDVDQEGLLLGIREAVHLRPAPGGGGRVAGLWSTKDELEGRAADLHVDTLVSMNLWGFTARMCDVVRRGLGAFLAGSPGNDRAECYLPDVVREAIARGEIRTRVLEAGTSCLGMTHPQDRADVVAALSGDVRWG